MNLGVYNAILFDRDIFKEIVKQSTEMEIQ